MDIVEVGDLQEAVEKDTDNHWTKDLAELFIAAITDWPTYNQTKIADFVQELKDYFGEPLTIDKINSKKLDVTSEQNVWRHVAGSAIAEMIDLSTRFSNESDFDKIVYSLSNYYKKGHCLTNSKALLKSTLPVDRL